MIPVAAHGGPLVIAHRGGGSEAPENSSAAFARLAQLGVHHIETDAYVSADGVVVLHHDPMVDRTYDGHGLVESMTWEELSRLRNEAGEQMPRLDHVLAHHPDVWLNIDTKSEAVVDPLLEVLAERDAFGRVMIASFSESRLATIRARGIENLSTSLGTSAVVRLVAAAQSGTNPESWHVPGPRHGVRAVQVPLSYGPMPIVTPRFVAAAHRFGLAVHVWTINEADVMARLADMGVDAVITDRPTMAKELLVARGQWVEPPTP